MTLYNGQQCGFLSLSLSLSQKGKKRRKGRQTPIGARELHKYFETRLRQRFVSNKMVVKLSFWFCMYLKIHLTLMGLKMKNQNCFL